MTGGADEEREHEQESLERGAGRGPVESGAAERSRGRPARSETRRR
jgi:hypothetical protein